MRPIYFARSRISARYSSSVLRIPASFPIMYADIAVMIGTTMRSNNAVCVKSIVCVNYLCDLSIILSHYTNEHKHLFVNDLWITHSSP